MRRLTALPLLLALLAMLGAGCGEGKLALRTQGETEGLHVDLGDLMYQVQLSRQLNPSDAEDQAYLSGLAPGTTPPGPDETWFGIFIRVQNVTERTLQPAESFLVVDTEEREYRPLVLDYRANAFAYRPLPLAPGEIIPNENTIAGQGVVAGSLILFKVKLESLQNRPVEFVIRSSQASGEALVDLDV